MLRLTLCVGAAAAAAAAAAAERDGAGRWGGVLGTRENLPTGLAAWRPAGGADADADADADASGRARVLAFAEEALRERWGGCGACCDAGGLAVGDVLRATRQVATFTRDGEKPHRVDLRSWSGEELPAAPLLLGAVYELRLAARLEEAPAGLGACAESTHDVTLFGDRDGVFSLVRHTWRHPAACDAAGLSAADRAVAGVLRPEGAALRLACYNIWNFNDPWPRRLELIAERLRERSPHVIAFQEVRHDNAGAQLGPQATRHQVDHLLWRLQSVGDWQVVWVPVMSYVQEDRGLAIQTEGPAIFSRLPVVHVEAVHLTRFWPEDRGDEHQRACLSATVETQIGRVNVLTTHLTLSADARMNNVYEICKFAKEAEANPQMGDVTVLTGDLNMIPSDPAMEYLLGRREYKGTRCDFVDMWEAAGVRRTHELGAAHEKDGFTFNNVEAKLQKRIDFVLVRSDTRRARLAAFEVFGARANAEEKIPPSDHLGLLATFESADAAPAEPTEEEL